MRHLFHAGPSQRDKETISLNRPPSLPTTPCPFPPLPTFPSCDIRPSCTAFFLLMPPLLFCRHLSELGPPWTSQSVALKHTSSCPSSELAHKGETSSVMLELHIVRASKGVFAEYDLVSLDPDSLGKLLFSELPCSSRLADSRCSSVAASYLQLFKPGEWEIVPSDTSLSPNGASTSASASPPGSPG